MTEKLLKVVFKPKALHHKALKDLLGMLTCVNALAD